MRQNTTTRFEYGCIGASIGGCLIPFILMLILGIGGPLFWPIVAIPLGIIGFLCGLGYSLDKKRSEDR